jgi:hypothetical protein
MKHSLSDKTTNLIVQDFELEPENDTFTEEELFELLSRQIEYMIEHRLDYLMSLMYRLDIPEGKVHYALSPLAEDPAHIGLTKLVMERQRQRLATKQHYKQQAPDDMDEGLKL